MTILDHYAREKQRFLENCIQCGLCAEGCPILPFTEISGLSAQKIQEDVFDFIENGTPSQQAYTKALACMECFKCTAGVCPENPYLSFYLWHQDLNRKKNSHPIMAERCLEFLVSI